MQAGTLVKALSKHIAFRENIVFGTAKKKSFGTWETALKLRLDSCTHVLKSGAEASANANVSTSFLGPKV